MNLKILTPEDWRAWKDFRLQALHDAPDAFLSSYDEEVLKPDNAFVHDITNNTIFVGMSGDQIVACAGFYRMSPTRVNHRGILWGMYTSPEYRRKGYADACINAVVKYAKSHVIQLHLSCVITNTSALHLYEKHGFSKYGTEPRALKINDHFVDEHLMCLIF